ncbi:hypothetical protein Plo01_57510 [Planobispora longispora]|uniref:Uncharacterized protein n=2 Tax=Planobispora longispora TaxID=28887 RepID=A0A8J3W803_9ACTN|nr:hypothetical protein [Planobispora longispora]BFE80683.1 hypothetical protein GCM10020093_032840 [Planobispora longispora]GIH79322.1 hypothetical protein Plo01_57510 [Planobispora longispora]
MFKVMFTEPCDPASQERAAVIAAISGYLDDIVRNVFPAREAEPLANALWVLVHGLAFSTSTESSTPPHRSRPPAVSASPGIPDGCSCRPARRTLWRREEGARPGLTGVLLSLTWLVSEHEVAGRVFCRGAR